MSDTIKKLTIEGFKSIRELKDFELRSLNVLIGANGAGKSNFVGFFRLLRQLVDQRLQIAVGKEGGAGRCLYLGPKMTKQLVAKLYLGSNGYEFVLIPTANDRLIFEGASAHADSARETIEGASRAALLRALIAAGILAALVGGAVGIARLRRRRAFG